MRLDFARVANVQCHLGEGPVYDERRDILYFVDILERRLHAIDLESSKPRSWSFDSEVACLGLAASGKLVIGLRHDVILFDPASEAKTVLCTIEAEMGSDTRLNDGKVGPDGAFWVGSMDDRKEKQPIGSLYRIAPGGRLETKVEGVTISNGLAWTADGERMFYADTRGPWIDRWRFDRWTGEMSERSRFAEPDDSVGRPDGAAVDAEGYYWSAGVSAGRLNRFDPKGTLVESIPVPPLAPTCPCFGGADFRTLFLTSLREGKSSDALAGAPETGFTLAAPAPVAGFAPWRFLDA